MGWVLVDLFRGSEEVVVFEVLSHLGLKDLFRVMLVDRETYEVVGQRCEIIWNWFENQARTGETRIQLVSPGNRRASKRVKLSPKDVCKAAFEKKVERTEACLLNVSMCTKDAKPELSVAAIRKIVKRWAPIHVNHVSPTLNTTVLLEVCKARETTEQVMVRVVRDLIVNNHADVNIPNQDNMTAACVAAARGLPNLLKLLVKFGADLQRKGSGSFRAYGSRKVLQAKEYTPLTWACEMLKLEQGAGLPDEVMHSLLECKLFLEKEQKKRIKEENMP